MDRRFGQLRSVQVYITTATYILLSAWFLSIGFVFVQDLALPGSSS